MVKNSLLKNVRIETGYLEEDAFVYGTQTQTVDVLIREGRISAVAENLSVMEEVTVVDGKGALLLPQLREMHCHFDKSKLGLPWSPVEPASDRIERFTKEFAFLEEAPLGFAERMKNLIELELAHGVTHFRSHIDIHPQVGQRYLEQAQQVLADYRDQLSYELVAFPQHGLLRSEAYQEMRRALQNGATLVGGVDPISIDGDLERSLNQTFELATEFKAPIDFHLHEQGDDARRTFGKLLALIEETGWQNQVTVSHAYGLKDLTSAERAEWFPRLAANGVTLISSVPLDFVIPPLEALRAAGVTVFLGNDNINDCWSPFGSGDILDKLNRYAEIFDLTDQRSLTESLPLITGCPVFDWLKVGAPANFTLVACSCSAEFVARKVPVTASFYQGQQVN